MKRIPLIYKIYGASIAAGLAVFACSPTESGTQLNGMDVSQLNGAQCGDLACKDVAPKYELLVKNIDASQPNSGEHNVVRIGMFISHDKDSTERPDGYDGEGVEELPDPFKSAGKATNCEILEDQDLGVRSALKMFHYLTGNCVPTLAELVRDYKEHTAPPDDSKNKTEGRTQFLKNPSWKTVQSGSSTQIQAWGKGPTLARSAEGVTSFTTPDSNEVTQLETHYYQFQIVLDDAGAALGRGFGEHLADPNTSMSFLWGHFYPADARRAAADQANTASGGQGVREYFNQRTVDIYGPMLEALKAGLAKSQKPYVLGFLVGCFSEQIENALIKAVKDSGAKTEFDWVGQRGRHNYLEFHNSLHRVLEAMHMGATFTHFDTDESKGILNSFVFGGEGLENRFSAEDESLRQFYDQEVPDKVIPVLRSNRYQTLANASGDDAAGFSYDDQGNIMIDQNGDTGR